MKRRTAKLMTVACGAIFALWLVCASPSPALAQCAMCKAAAAASGNDALNTAILVLLIPPVVIFCAIFIVAYRLREAQGDTPRKPQEEKRAQRGWMENPEAG